MPKPKVGDPVTLHGTPHTIASIAGARVVIEPKKNPSGSSVAMNAADLSWNDDDDTWTLPGREQPRAARSSLTVAPPKGKE